MLGVGKTRERTEDIELKWPLGAHSTLATLGHPVSSASPALLGLQHPQSPSPVRTASFALFSLSRFYCLADSFRVSSPNCTILSFSVAVSSLSDRDSASSSFGFRVLLFRSSAFLSFRSLARSARCTFLLTATLRTNPFCGLYRTHLSLPSTFSPNVFHRVL